MDDNEKYLRWLETTWDLHEGITREEQRKEEVLKVFKGLSDISSRRVEAPRFPPWEALW
jgi:hypothetical protein